MEKMVSICGLHCDECGAFIATMRNDDQKRKETAAEWSKQFGADIQWQDVNCKGCLSDVEPVFSHCRVCEIRLCGRNKKVANCAHCKEYVCGKLEKFFRMAPQCRTTLDGIRASL
jgi:hypothetical protein